MSTSCPSLVHNRETSEQFEPQPTYAAILRRSCKRSYAAALRIYLLLDGGPDNGRARRLADCRQNAWFTRNSDSGEVRVASSCCHLRWCPVCANARRNYVTHSVAEWLGNANHPKLITLTLRHTNAPLEHQIQHLYNYFRELRRRKDFKKAVTGGMWFFQIKKSSDDGMWHPHLHCLVTGLYLPRRRLSRMWMQITYGSMVTDIRPIHDPVKVANDVARYATSPGSLVDLPPDDAIEMVEALHGRRICGTWGDARGISLRPKKQDEKGKWVSLGSWTIVMAMYESDQDARAIVLSWKTGIFLPTGISCNRMQQTIDRMTDPAWAEYDFESIYNHERIPP